LAALPRPWQRISCIFAEAHDVPDDQKVPGEFELFDERKFAFNLVRGRRWW
jgi:hypothetical protein